MKILGIDPGQLCGWSIRDENGHHISGVWNLKPTPRRAWGVCMVELSSWLQKFIERAMPDIVVYEEVRGHKGTDAAHAYGRIVGQIEATCEVAGVPCTGIGVGTVKKYATGKGNANKEAMWSAAKERWPGEIISGKVGYDEVDARWIAEAYAQEMT